jgi:AAA+ ATPase superfamily predicted ATPase
MIGRKEEQAELQEIVESKQSEFVAVFGRRRVGKTFLIKEFFNNKFSFFHTGIANSDVWLIYLK